jgi:hypothetical protein
MPNKLKHDLCNCLALRQAARHVTQFYDHYLVPTGVRATQFSILAMLEGLGPISINALAEDMVMDRTTLGRNIQPLRRCVWWQSGRGGASQPARHDHARRWPSEVRATSWQV